MDIKQEPKYTTNEAGQIVTRASGEAIPDDEPIFIFRARDRHARLALDYYFRLCNNYEHRAAIRSRVNDFDRFAEQHPERMKEPDTAGAGGA